MITGFILPAIAVALLWVFFKMADGFQLAKGIVVVWLGLAMVLFHAFSWASTLSLIMILALILVLAVLIAYSYVA